MWAFSFHWLRWRSDTCCSPRSGVEWIIHAVTCAKPKLKLRRVLERRGFVVKNVEGVGEACYLWEAIRDPTPRFGHSEC